MTIVLDDITGAEKLYPFGQVKSVGHIRIGMLTILEKWQHYFKQVILLSENQDPEGEVLTFSVLDIPSPELFSEYAAGNYNAEGACISLIHPADIFKNNDRALRQDFDILTKNKKSNPLPGNVIASAANKIFIAPGAVIKSCFINAETGPVYISENAEIMEGAMLRGPLYIGVNSVVKMGAKIYGATTIGPYCIAGGEIKNTVLMGYSNKAHDGYLGDSVLGEWCNLGAGTSNSNLKNNASQVRVFSVSEKKSVDVGIKCGLLLGDYSRSAINTSFNTGTIAGICCNILGGRPEKIIPDFSWGSEKYDLQKVFRDIDNWKKLKGFKITEEEKISLQSIYKKI